MSPIERRKELSRKKYCGQCLEPGVKFNDEHESSRLYACPNDAHLKFKKSLHVLVCNTHKNNQENLGFCQKNSGLKWSKNIPT